MRRKLIDEEFDKKVKMWLVELGLAHFIDPEHWVYGWEQPLRSSTRRLREMLRRRC